MDQIEFDLDSREGALRCENLVAAIEAALADGNDSFVAENAGMLQDMVDQIQRRTFELSRLQYRACLALDAAKPRRQTIKL